MLGALPKNAFVVTLDGRGKPYTSEQLAQRLEHWRAQGRDLAFLIGGPEGHAPDVLASAQESWSLGPLTLRCATRSTSAASACSSPSMARSGARSRAIRSACRTLSTLG